MRHWATPTQMRRFSDSLALWMSDYVTEACTRPRFGDLDVNQYLALRAGSIGGVNAVAAGEVAYGLEVPATERDSWPVRAASEAAMLIAALDNDRYSLAKSKRQKEENPDLFTVIQRNHPEYSFSRALAEGIAVRDRILALYKRLRDQELAAASAQLRGYFQLLDDLRGLAFSGQASDRLFHAAIRNFSYSA